MAWISASLAIAALSFLLPQGMRTGRIVLFVGILGATGCSLMWAKAALVSHPVLERPVFTQFIGRVMDMEPLPARDIVRVTLHQQQRRDLPPVIRVNIAEKDVPQGLAVGSFISLRSRLMPPAAAAVPEIGSAHVCTPVPNA